jgi:UDP-N-acetylmuramate--alanine ligase
VSAEGSKPQLAPQSLRVTGHPGMPHAHLVGIAGAGMRALADVLSGLGWSLSGSDLSLGSIREMAAAGVRLFQGHSPGHVSPETKLVVYSSAIGADNPELRRAAELGIPTLSYFQMLGRITSSKDTLAVAGTHGKSTTTAMAAQILIEAGRDPMVFLGATPMGASSGGRAGRGDLLLVEACEYQANFLHLRPRRAAVLGIEADHFDCFDSLEAVERAFAQFAALVPPEGMLVAPHDCESTRRVTAELACPVETFGVGEGADWSARNLISRRGHYGFELCHHAEGLGSVRLRVPGRHNVLNALAAAALAHSAGVESRHVVRGLEVFLGLHRRLEPIGTWRGIMLMDDYAHHPTEVSVSLAALRQMFPRHRLWCVFQPHQALRTARLLDELAESLQNSDRVVVAEIFRAREGPARDGEVTAHDLAGQVRAGGVEVADVHTAGEILSLLENCLVPGDVLVTMGAGDIGNLSHGLIERLREDRAAG